jgi:RNA polymerase sigma-70 factor (ECF subfamily)
MSTMSATLEPRTSAGPAPLDFDALYRDARDDVYAYVVTLLRDRGAAEDVTAQAFERAFRKARSYDSRKGGPRSWLFGIARHAALDELRRGKRLATLVAEPVDAAAAPRRGRRARARAGRRPRRARRPAPARPRDRRAQVPRRPRQRRDRRGARRQRLQRRHPAPPRHDEAPEGPR